MTTYFAPAKINLWLRIFEPDETGYHPLDTLFCALDFCDEITVALKGDRIDLAVEGDDVGPAEKNLAHRAAAEFYHITGLAPRVSIRLSKRIPAGAGLGGGSSDAATVLLALNEMHGGLLPNDDMLAIAARLGSDVPFFLCGSSLAHATGRGEILQAMPPLRRLPVVVVAPSFPVSTVEAYRWLDEARAFSPNAISNVTAASWDDVIGIAHNDFESVLFDRMPRLQAMREALQSTGARLVLLSGSGSAIFAIYEDEAERDRAAGRLQQKFADARIISTNTRS